MDAKNYRQFIKESENQDEGKLVASQLQIISALMSKLKDRAEKELSKNQEKGVAFLNTLGSFVGAKVTDKKQAKNKLFLKMEYIKEDAAVDAANLKAKQAEEIEREQRAIDLQKEKETENKAIESERESQRKAAQNEELEEAGLWDNIRAKRARGERMRKKGEKGAPTQDQIKRAQEDKEEQDADVKDKEGTQPKKYYKGLDKKTKEKRDAHFKKKVSGPAPGDEDEDGKPIKTKPSVHTKKFKKMYGEKLDANSDAGDYVKDFRKSDAPQFKGKSDKKIQKMAIAAYLSRKEK